jgi:hypothetical protein
MEKKYSDGLKKYLKYKFHKMRNEKKSQTQKTAIALSKAREAGYKVPEKK